MAPDLPKKAVHRLWRGITRVATFEIMWREIARRMFVSVLAVALATAMVARSANASNAGASNSDVSAVMTMGTDMPMHGKCNGCAGNEKAMSPGACSAYCNAVVAFPLLAIAYHPVQIATVEPRTVPAKTGHAAAPDPYPPRPTSMN